MAKSKISPFEVSIVERFSGGVKGLPKNPNTGQILSVFEANGRKYYILTGADAFPVSRFVQYAQLSAQFMAGAEMTNAYAQLVRFDKMLDDVAMQRARFSDLALLVKSQMKELQGISEARYHTGFYLASLFIVREGEDISKWTFAEAEEKIADWSAEKYTGDDFFGLAAHYLAAYTEKLNNFLSVANGGAVAHPTPASESTE